jgi:hypothetical protein
MLIETSLINSFRLSNFWEVISSHLLFVIKHTNASIRKYGVDCINDLIQSIKLDNDDLQILFIQTFKQMFHIEFIDVKINTLKSLSNLINKNGEILTKGWSIIIPILKSSCDDKRISNFSFKCVNIIGTDFLENLPTDCLIDYILTVGNYAIQTKSDDVNPNLVSITLLMSISDYISNKLSKDKK